MDTEMLVDKIIEQTVTEGHQADDNDNGYVDVQDLMQNINRNEALPENKVIVAEPDSSSITEPLETTLADEINKIKSQVKQPEVVVAAGNKQQTTSKCSWLQSSSTSNSVCQFWNTMTNYVESDKCLKSFILWENPKYTGAILVITLLLIELIARNSLLLNIGTYLLVTMVVAGSYRVYVFVMNRVKGQEDQIFKQLASYQFEIPRGTLVNLAEYLENNANVWLNRMKILILWDNLYNSALAFFVAYVLYSVGSVFNTLELLSLTIVFVFTLPKIYTVYKVQIDSGLMKVHDVAVDWSGRIKSRLPMIFKSKAN